MIDYSTELAILKDQDSNPIQLNDACVGIVNKSEGIIEEALKEYPAELVDKIGKESLVITARAAIVKSVSKYKNNPDFENVLTLAVTNAVKAAIMNSDLVVTG